LSRKIVDKFGLINGCAVRRIISDEIEVRAIRIEGRKID